MASSAQWRNSFDRINLRTQKLVLSLATLFLLTILATLAAQAQTYTILHNFTGNSDGAGPMAGLTMDQAGNLYGTAETGGKR